MDVQQIKVGFLEVFSYIVVCPTTKEALVIDPAGEEDRLVEIMGKQGLKLRYIVNTHGHVDHICGNARVKELTGAPIVVHELDAEMLGSPRGQAMARQWGFTPSPPADRTVIDGERLAVGDVSLEVLHTPGHSPGGMCLLGDGNVFTGDTLFVGAIGRTDLPGASLSVFMQSIKERLLTLPDDTVVWPGHDYGMKPSSTIGFERRTNPWLGDSVTIV